MEICTGAAVQLIRAIDKASDINGFSVAGIERLFSALLVTEMYRGWVLPYPHNEQLQQLSIQMHFGLNIKLASLSGLNPLSDDADTAPQQHSVLMADATVKGPLFKSVDGNTFIYCDSVEGTCELVQLAASIQSMLSWYFSWGKTFSVEKYVGTSVREVWSGMLDQLQSELEANSQKLKDANGDDEKTEISDEWIAKFFLPARTGTATYASKVSDDRKFNIRSGPQIRLIERNRTIDGELVNSSYFGTDLCCINQVLLSHSHLLKLT